MPNVVKVTLNGRTLIDHSDSTAEAGNMLLNTVAYEGDGDRVTGSVTIPDVYQMMEQGTAIPENADLDDYVTIGIYWASGDVVLPTLSNAPFATDSYKGFSLEIAMIGGTLTQTATSYSGDVRTRYYQHWLSTPTWSEWVLEQSEAFNRRVKTTEMEEALAVKADSTNPSLTWNIGDETVSATLRRSGSSPTYGLAVVTNPSGSDVFNTIINSDGTKNWVNATYSDVGSSAISVSSGTTTNLCSFSLSAGIWIVEYYANFGSNTNGYRRMMVSSSATGNSVGNYCDLRVAPPTGANANLSGVWIATATGNVTRYLNVYQNSGSSLTVSGGVRLIKLA